MKRKEISFSVSEEEHKRIVKYAEKEGMIPSALAKNSLFKRINKE